MDGCTQAPSPSPSALRPQADYGGGHLTLSSKGSHTKYFGPSLGQKAKAQLQLSRSLHKTTKASPSHHTPPRGAQAQKGRQDLNPHPRQPPTTIASF